jgi:hypothetical protein
MGPYRRHRNGDGTLEQSGFKTEEHSGYSPDLVRCDFFPFGYMKAPLERRSLQRRKSYYLCFLNL